MVITARQASLAVVGFGALLVVYGAWQWWDGERTFARMRPTTCTVMSRVIDAKLLVSSSRRSVKPPTARIREEAHLLLAHTLDGRQHRFSEDFVYDWAEYARAGYEQGKDYPCRYDPRDPGRGTIRSAFESSGPTDIIALGGVVMLLALVAPRLWREVARARAGG